MSFILVDAANLFHRAKFGIRGDAFTKSGMILHVMLNSIKKAYQMFNGEHVVLCLEGHSWRNEIYRPYKAHRRLKRLEMSPAEKEEEKYLLSVFDDFLLFIKNNTNMTVLQAPNAEADDFIARWIQLHPNEKHVIVSSDTDYYQLIADNVTIYDGMGHKYITTNGVFDEKHKPIMDCSTKKFTITETGSTWFTVKEDISAIPYKGKFTYKGTDFPYELVDGDFTIKRTTANLIVSGGKITIDIEQPIVIEPEWELFKKIVRGDSADNIFSAYPKVREQKIRAAYEARHGKTFEWQNFMQQTWEDHNGTRCLVMEQFNLNRTLIDLTAQPEHIVADLDDTIISSVQKKVPNNQIGFQFLLFCKRNELVNIGKYSDQYLPLLCKGYQR